MRSSLLSFPQRALAHLILGLARLLTGTRAHWSDCRPSPQARVYFANHSSHLDFILIWSALPQALRCHTHPVAAADYWQKTALRRYLIHRVFDGVLVERNPPRHEQAPSDALTPLQALLQQGDSLILFPEGQRNSDSKHLLPFKSGLYHLARSVPQAEIIPVWISNAGRALPKGHTLPLPLLCALHFGAPLSLQPGEEKEAFLERASAALHLLSQPPHDTDV